MDGQGGIIRQKKLQLSDGIVLMLSATLGSQFIFLLGPMLETPLLTCVVMAVFFAGSILGTFLLWRTVQVTRLTSFQEIAYYLSGNRASIIFISVILVGYYATLPMQLLTYLSLSVASILDPNFNIVKVDGIETLPVNPVYYTITIISIAALLLPLCLIQDM